MAQMIPIRIQIRNFLSYGEKPQEISLEGIPLAALVGKNGAGKSSLLDAITWSLFGEARSGRNEQIIRKGASEMSVLLEFDVDGQKFRIQRRFSRKSRSHIATLEQFTGEKWRPVVVEGGVSAVNKEVKRLLRMDYETFVNTVFMPQGQSGRFMSLDPSERRDLLAKVLGLEDWEKLFEKAKEQVKTLTVQIQESQRRIGEIDEELKKKPQIQQEFEEKERQKEHMQEMLEQVDKEIAQVQQRRERLMKEKVRLEHLQNERNSIQRNITETQETIAKHQSQLERWQQFVAKEAEIMEAYRKFLHVQKIEAELSEKANKLRELELKRHQLEQAILKAKANLENEMRAKEENKASIQERLNELQKIIAGKPEVERKLAELQKTKAELRDWDERQKQWQEVQQKRSQIEQNIAAERARMEQREKELKRGCEQIEIRTLQKPTIEEQLRRLEEAKAKLEDWKREKDKAQDRRQKIASQIAMLEAKQEQLQKSIVETEEKLHLLEAHKGEAQCPLCETLLKPEKVASLKRKLKKERERLDAEFEETKQQRASLEQSLKQLEDFIAQAEKELQKLPEIEQRLGKAKEQIAQLEDYEKELERLKEEIERLREQKEEAEKIWASQLEKIEEREKLIGYDQSHHQQIRQKVENLARSEAEMEQISKAEEELKIRTEQLQRLVDEIEALKRKLSAEDFAYNEKKELERVKEDIKSLGYDEKQHQQIKVWLQNNQHILQCYQQLQTAKEQIPQLQDLIESAKRQIAESQKRSQEIETEIKDLQAKTAQLPEVEEQFSELQGRRKARENELLRLREEIGILREKLEGISRLEQEKNQLEQRLERMLNDKRDYELLEEAFGRSGIPKRILKSAVQWLEWEANQLLVRLTQGRMHLRFALETPTQKGSQKETLAIVIADELGDRPYELYSGGEKFRIDIALRIALARLLAHRSGARLRTLVIDEGFGSQDAEGLEAIAETIKSVAKEFSRVLVVTHLDEFREYFPVQIEVEKDSNGSRCRLIETNDKGHEEVG
ncbi:MAG: SMC family ATPase [Armatimonadota bacterium]|nr:SMC family ATPase [Armatimonadota bacterium]